MQVTPARLQSEILLGSDRICYRRALERRADVEAPEFLKCFIVIRDYPAVLQRGEYETAGSGNGTRADLNLRNCFRDDLVVNSVESSDRAVIQVAGVGALVARLL